ncbi:unnamed protein product [Dovyalis caffra]|uniref:Uncharacterized protein n=1 Tax=Dovyalis caffra TaxID=77055 RepID=A0AAV1SJY4_9ROSI|nr:unnamed protein product [Dovyalis caffra]
MNFHNAHVLDSSVSHYLPKYRRLPPHMKNQLVHSDRASITVAKASLRYVAACILVTCDEQHNVYVQNLVMLCCYNLLEERTLDASRSISGLKVNKEKAENAWSQHCNPQNATRFWIERQFLKVKWSNINIGSENHKECRCADNSNQSDARNGRPPFVFEDRANHLRNGGFLLQITWHGRKQNESGQTANNNETVNTEAGFDDAGFLDVQVEADVNMQQMHSEEGFVDIKVGAEVGADPVGWT